ncbi:MAG: hypothetical protein AAGD25_30055 [Cyanobacteria bacterium P01_F01_bin.150]
MQWLITTKIDVTLEQLSAMLSRLGCQPIPEDSSIPLDEAEQVISVEGPDDLPGKLEGNAEILQIYPDSSLELY